MNKYLIFNAKNQYFEFEANTELTAITDYIENKIGFAGNGNFSIDKDDWTVIANALVNRLGPSCFPYIIKAVNGFCSNQELKITRIVSGYSDVV